MPGELSYTIRTKNFRLVDKARFDRESRPLWSPGVKHMELYDHRQDPLEIINVGNKGNIKIELKDFVFICTYMQSITFKTDMSLVTYRHTHAH